MATLVCKQTGTRYPADEPRWRSDAGGLLDLEFEPHFDLDRIRRRPPGLWRYREALPIDHDKSIVSFGEGFTPLVETSLFSRPLHVKLDHLFPSGSYKDRGATVLISKARELGVRHVVEDSSGNAGAAIATYCAAAGIACDIYVPASNSPGKLVQIELLGARLHAVPGTREDTAAACLAAAEQHYYASHTWNPYFFHGTKTFAYEVVEQLGWRAPDAIVVPVGNGTLLCGVFIGLRELRDAGLIEALPRLIGVQAAGCAPLHDAWRDGRDSIAPFASQPTVAEGIAIAEPIRAADCLAVIRATQGEIVTVTDDEIAAALRTAVNGGYYIEPTAAAALAGATQVDAEMRTVVVPLTGHGLKSGASLAKYANRQ